jgi:branched-subunit amino acid ABC-type transport system permease component
VALLVAAVVSGAFGFAFEHVIIRRVYGSHLQQILITVGGLIVAEQLIVVVWGAEPLHVAKPEALRGSFIIGGAAIEKYRIAAVALGLLVYLAMHLVLNRTRIGLLVRAGVENREMVEALGFRVRRLFVGVFIAGTALAGIGGVMWAVYQELVTTAIGADMTILMFIVVIIGGLGSVSGCFVGAISSISNDSLISVPSMLPSAMKSRCSITRSWIGTKHGARNIKLRRNQVGRTIPSFASSAPESTSGPTNMPTSMLKTCGGKIFEQDFLRHQFFHLHV